MKQFRIGLMVGNKTIDYPHSVRMGVQNTLRDEGQLLVPIADLVPYHSRTNAIGYFRVAFELAARLDLDCIIVPAGIITGYLTGDDAKMRSLLHTLNASRTLVLEREIPGYRCITKDNAPGMHACMKHLIETCGFKEIAFISGPETSQGAREREAIYFEEMKSHGLETPDRLFARGLFSGDCDDVIEMIIDDNPRLEAIACSCDFIAYTAYHVLRKRKRAIGSEIAVTGFDDHPKSAHVDPPLSTVHMTGYDLGCMAAREAIRLCEHREQSEKVLSSRFITRSSCGEDDTSGVEYFREMFRQQPFPKDRFIDVMMDATMSLADRRTTSEFRVRMEEFFEKIRKVYLAHRDEGVCDQKFFSSADLTALFDREYRQYLSLEGFHDVAMNLLEALSCELPKEDTNWIINQIGYLHLRIARLQFATQQDDTLAMNKREWNTFRIVDDALRVEDADKAYHSIISEVKNLGVRYARLFKFPETVQFIGAKTFAMSDRLIPIGYAREGSIVMESEEREISLHQVLSEVLDSSDGMEICTVGGIMAGDELMGLAVLDSGDLDDNGQLMAFLNIGFAMKHLQMISVEREMNELLRQSNVELAKQSTQDVMTQLLNRRGFMDGMMRMLSSNIGQRAAVIYLDMDGLKHINDTYGHEIGDDAIRNMAGILKKALPENAILGRLGGDEFIALLLVSNDLKMNLFCRDVEDGALQFNLNNKSEYYLSVSYGGICFDVEENSIQNINSLMIEADEKLYAMKKKRSISRRYSGQND